VGILAVSAYASFIKFWPYDLSFVLSNYQFDLMDGGGWAAYWNSIVMATATAFFGTLIIFSGAYLVEKSQRYGQFRSVLQLLAILPLAVPGMVLGLAYIFFFNNPANPLTFLYQTMGILVYKTFSRVTFPVCVPAILDISIYLFVNAMTTVSAVVFLWGPETHLASVAVLNMDDQGDIAPAAAMAMMIFYTSAGVRLLYAGLTRGLHRRTQTWRAR
jgi:iron(III) transport system permease protein